MLYGQLRQRLTLGLAVVAVVLFATKSLRRGAQRGPVRSVVATQPGFPSLPTPTSTASGAPAGSASVAAATPAANASERAIIAPLTEGGQLGGFTLRELHPVERGRMRLVLQQEKARVSLDIALLDDAGTIVPAATTSRYAVYYALQGASADDGAMLATGLTRLLKANESAPAPPGMTVFKPAPPPGMTL